MRILQITALFPPLVVGGAERSAASLNQGLYDRGHDMHVLTLVPNKLPERQDYVQDGIHLNALHLHNLYWPYDTKGAEPKPSSKITRLLWHVRDVNNHVMVQRVREHVARIQPDVVLTHNLQGFSTAIWPAIAALKVPIVHTVHDFALLCPQTVLFRKGKNCGFGPQRCLGCRVLSQPRWRHAQDVSAVVGVSNAVLRIHREHGLFLQIPSQVIHNSMPSGVQPEPRVRASNDGRLVFGFLGRVDRAKGFDTLLAAFSRLPPDRVRLVVGGKADEAFLAQMRAQYDFSQIEMLGFCDPREVFSQVDALVFPTYGLEALGNGVFEAYFHGLPVIGSESGGIPEMIEPGETGFVFPPGDIGALEAHMRRFIEVPGLALAMQAACLARALYFLPERRIDTYVQFIQRTAQRA